MSFEGYTTVAELSLTDRISIRDLAASYASWVTGKVVELSLLGDDMHDIRVMLLLDDGTTQNFDRAPDCTVIREH